MHYESVVTDTFPMRAVSLEANIIGNAVAAIKGYFPRLKEAIMPAFTKLDDVKPFIGKDSNFHKLKPQEKDVEDFLASIGYENASYFTVPVPEGFVGNYVNYARELFNVLDYTLTASLPAIDAYYARLGNLITNKDPKLSNKDITKEYQLLAKDRVAANGKLTAFFLRGSNQAQNKFSKIFNNTEEVAELFRLRHKMVDSIKEYPLSKVKKTSEKITESLDVLIQLANTGKLDYITGAQLKNITEGAYEIARQIEFFAINYYRFEIMINTIALVRDRILELRRNHNR